MDEKYETEVGTNMVLYNTSCLFNVFFSSYKVWIGDNIHVHNDVIIVLGIYTIAQILAGTYMYIINGIGKVRLQMIVYLLFAIISIPLMIVLGKAFGIMGIISVPILVYVTQSIVARIQLDMLITDQARGIWNK